MTGRLTTARRGAVYGLLFVLGGLFTSEAYRVFFGRNWHTVLAGRVYRSAQLSPQQLKEAIRAHGIRTVVNLRGCCADLPWYLDEARMTHDLDVAQEDVTLSAVRLPPADEVRRVVEVIDRAQYPLLIHCRQGVDRTGLVAALILLLTTETPYPEARRQLGLRFGHVALGPTRILSAFFASYERWLSERGLAHGRDAFRQWACNQYCPGRCRGTIELLDRPSTLTIGESAAVQVRVCNLSTEPWHFRPGTGTGIHVRFLLFDEAVTIVQVGRSGEFTAEVLPGDSIDLTLALAPLARPGRYGLIADVRDGQASALSQYGLEPLQLELHVTSRE